jgi:hypothetical protein
MTDTSSERSKLPNERQKNLEAQGFTFSYASEKGGELSKLGYGTHEIKILEVKGVLEIWRKTA